MTNNNRRQRGFIDRFRQNQQEEESKVRDLLGGNGQRKEQPSTEQEEFSEQRSVGTDEHQEHIFQRPFEEEQQEQNEFAFDMTPKMVKLYLDRFVIGQDRAKKVLSNGICYHFKRVARELAEDQQQELGLVDSQGHSIKKNGHIKKNILLIGNTGVGKTYMVNKLSKLVNVPFVKTDMTKYSATGYVGGDVEDIIRELYVKADKNKPLAERGIVYLDEFDKIASYSASVGKDVNGLEVQRTLLKLLEETEVGIMPSKMPMGLVAPQGQSDNFGKINTKNVLFICSGAFPGLEDVVRNRLKGNYDWRDHITAQDVVAYGMEAELVGRLPIRAALNDLSAADLYKIMKESEESLIPKYQADFKEYGIELTFEDDALKIFAERAAKSKTGARALVGEIESTLLDFMYELPGSEVTELTVTKDLVEQPKKYLTQILSELKPTETTIQHNEK